MQRRKFGRLELETSALGLGCMRLPLRDEDFGNIDEEKAIELIRYAIDKGVNYIDTAYPYHRGNSELVVGKALADGYRARVKLATKLPMWSVKEYEDFDRLLDEQLSKLQTDYIDVYLLHALNKNTWQNGKNLGVLEWLDKALADGRIRHAAFSFHDKFEVFKEIVDAYDWDMCQIQYNYMDTNYQAGTEGLEYAAGKGMAIVVMEPLRGGKLAKNVPPEVHGIFAAAEVERTPVDWALRWIWNRPEVAVILSGMGTKAELDENIRTTETALPNSLSSDELAIIAKARDFYLQKTKVGCTDCGYCQPCPSNVAIPMIFDLYNTMSMFGSNEESAGWYKNMTKDNRHAEPCVECGQCEAACPQNLAIIEHLKEAHKALSA